jgi:hypothetical protein
VTGESPASSRYCLCSLTEVIEFELCRHVPCGGAMTSLFADSVGFCENGLHFPDTAYGQRWLFNDSQGLCGVGLCWKTSHALQLASGTCGTYLLGREVFRVSKKGKGKVHCCTGTGALYRLYGQ